MLERENFKVTNTLFEGFFIGCVEDNKDPNKAGRVRTRILGVHSENKSQSATDGIPTNELPWAIPVNPIAGGSVSGLGLNGVPVQGSWVVIFFIGGNHNCPAYFGSVSGISNSGPDPSSGFNDPDGEYPKETGPDWNKYARGEKVDHGAAVGPEPSSTAAPEYPFNTVFETPGNGIVVEYDSTPGSERYQIFHKGSKSYIEMSNTQTVIKGKNLSVISEGKIDVYSNGTCTIESAGTCNVLGGAVNLGAKTGLAIMLNSIITKFNTHQHINTKPGNVDEMSGTPRPDSFFVEGTDSTTISKAK